MCGMLEHHRKRRRVSVKVEHIVPILKRQRVEASFVWFAKLGWDKQFRVARRGLRDAA
jgi:hypothetical protein